MAAATDQNYRHQKTLDIVFAVTCILMLVGIIWMYAQDQYRDWKVEQREFRNVEEAIYQRKVVRAAPDASAIGKIDETEREVMKAREEVDKKRQEVQPLIDRWLPEKVKSEDKFQAIKAELDSKVSLYDIAVNKQNAEPVGSSRRNALRDEAYELAREVDDLRAKLADAQNKIDANKAELAKAMKPLTDAEKDLSTKEDKLKELVGEFDRFHRMAEQKRWGAGDWFRNLPVIDAFAPPLKIQQYTLNDLPINYNFKYVTRYDRCTTCHMGIDNATFDRAAIDELRKDPSPALQQKLKDAQESLRKRQEIRKSKEGLNADDIQLTKLSLTDAQIKEFSAHPRLDLFVDGNSKHPGESFGCTICHGGQGSATDFFNASHMPNDARQMALWRLPPTKANEQRGHDWKSNHFWDYPMLPSRFLESSCVKCHHQVTDLIREGSKNEAPKLLRGYNLVRENGCFGCHEIAGNKAGQQIGPDMRLEPVPPLVDYTPTERAKILADSQNPPGNMRKIGPSLRRISEKTNENWARLWVKSPRTFRPDTKMPHFFMLSNNTRDVLESQGGEQADFPDAEIHSIVHYLMKESRAYLRGSDKFRLANQARLEELTAKKERSDKENREIDEIQRRLELFKLRDKNGKTLTPAPLWRKGDKAGKEVIEILVDADSRHFEALPELPKDDKAKEEQLKRGRQWFSERGCLACHMNNATAQPGNGLPALDSEAHFGPNLSRIAAKLGTADSARPWLVAWIVNPNNYHPRTFMPITHLDISEASDVAAWLLSQKAPDWDEEAKKLNVPRLVDPNVATLERLARVYLERGYSAGEVRRVLKNGFSAEELKGMRLDQDERELEGPFTDDDVKHDKLATFIGKKAVGQLGCFGCHDIPGFEYAKPIGTPLNDWGKKDPERLAFEDVSAYARKNHYFVPGAADKDGKLYQVNKDGQTPYDRYFYESLHHHQREGFLYQKLREPRSFDYGRRRAWDDRLRMPQFRFSRKTPGPQASAEEQAKAEVEEAEAREAVMTFILGLVAEPIPTKYVYAPTVERAAEVKGRQVLDKFNCAGCHLIRSGVYEFKNTPMLQNLLQVRQRDLDSRYSAEDFKFKDHNAWVGTNPVNGPTMTVHGVARLVDLDDDTLGLRGLYKDDYKIDFPASLKNVVEVRLTQAVRVPFKEGGKEEVKDLPAGSRSDVYLLPGDMIYPPVGQLTAPDIGPYGGTFANLLVRYLHDQDEKTYAYDTGRQDSSAARPLVPPLLLREGEKTQPDWLFRFLREPHQIRPLAKLRMPKFNMSDDDARALVDYFAAADRLSNPAFGLQFPFFVVKERDESYMRTSNNEYVQRLQKPEDDKWFKARIGLLKPIWQSLAEQEIKSLEGRLKAAEETVKIAKTPDDKKKAEEALKALQKEKSTIDEELKEKKFVSYERQWQKHQAYEIDSFRLVAGDGSSACLGCHQVGSIKPPGLKAPDLGIAWQRLRPEWTERWIANPDRFLTYVSTMPQNFPHNKPQDGKLFLGDPRQNVTAARDYLMMYPHVMELPIIRVWPPLVFEGEKK